MTIIIIAAILALAVLIAGLVWFSASTARKIQTTLPARGRFMEIDGERIHYVDTGGIGPAVVMIHGLGGNLLHFNYALASLLAAEFRLILVDRPGSGYSSRAAGADATLTAQAAAIGKLIRSLGLTRPLVVGHSLGGAISLALALDHPDCVGGLALLAPLTHSQDEVPAILRRLAIRSSPVRNLVAWTLATPLGIRGGPAALKEVFAPEAVVPDFPLRAGGLLGLRPKAFYAASSDILAINDVLPAYVKRYPSLDLPLGILFGKADRLLDYRAHGEAMKASCPALDLELIDGGHMLPMTAPDRCAALIRRIAARQQEGSRGTQANVSRLKANLNVLAQPESIASQTHARSFSSLFDSLVLPNGAVICNRIAKSGTGLPDEGKILFNFMQQKE
jgi:pimeloyl-ACP methyl ester carboxylesterase